MIKSAAATLHGPATLTRKTTAASAEVAAGFSCNFLGLG